ncbi:MAG TPA: hypothetical protein VGH05_14980 [Buttiauxella sp.]|jgi:hypothetical protein
MKNSWLGCIDNHKQPGTARIIHQQPPLILVTKLQHFVARHTNLWRSVGREYISFASARIYR